MNKSVRVIVIGGGITGATVAANLSVQGQQVSLLEKQTVGGNGATQYSGALFRLFDPDPEIARLTRNSVELMETSRVGEVFAQSLRRCGILYACEKTQLNDDAISRCIAQHSDALYALERVSPQAACELSNGCYPSDNVRTLLYEPKGGVGDIRKTARDMAHLVRSYGNLVLENAHINAISSTASGVTVRCGSFVLEADYLVLAAGAWSRQLADELPIDTRSIPLASLRARRESPIPIIDTETGTHVIPLQGGYYQAGSKIRASAVDPESLRYDTGLIVPDILGRLKGSGLEHTAADVVTVLEGFDSYTADGRPVVDFIDVHKRCVAATGFCGIGYKVALAVAERVKYMLLSEEMAWNSPFSDSRHLFASARFYAPETVQ